MIDSFVAISIVNHGIKDVCMIVAMCGGFFVLAAAMKYKEHIIQMKHWISLQRVIKSTATNAYVIAHIKSGHPIGS